MTRPLVLLHGFTGSPESWADVLEGVGPSVPALAPAALGHDGTPGPDAVRTFEAEVDRLAGVIRARHGTGSHLVGYSMGGRLALGLLVRHTDLFDSATLIGASPGLTEPRKREARIARDEEWARLLEQEGIPTFVAAWEALPLFRTQESLLEERRARQDRIRRAHHPRGLARSLRVLGLGAMPDYRTRLARVKVPVRLVAGEADPKFRALAGEMAGLLPHATQTVVADAGHNVVLEKPEEIARLLREDMNP